VQGWLTVSQLAGQLGIRPHWIYDRIHIGLIAITRDASSGLYLFPDLPSLTVSFSYSLTACDVGASSTDTWAAS
jgi:hypothetical protein